MTYFLINYVLFFLILEISPQYFFFLIIWFSWILLPHNIPHLISLIFFILSLISSIIYLKKFQISTNYYLFYSVCKSINSIYLLLIISPSIPSLNSYSLLFIILFNPSQFIPSSHYLSRIIPIIQFIIFILS